ncbi:MAG: hypothetical protein KDB11_13960, partial [Planctomycetales bacterium]|nr:hypothetical protein [Planctomycetales bacterium]
MNTRIRPAAGSRKHGARCHEAWRKQWQRRQRRIARRLDKQHREPNDGLSGERPVLQGANVQCVMGERQC